MFFGVMKYACHVAIPFHFLRRTKRSTLLIEAHRCEVTRKKESKPPPSKTYLSDQERDDGRKRTLGHNSQIIDLFFIVKYTVIFCTFVGG